MTPQPQPLSPLLTLQEGSSTPSSNDALNDFLMGDTSFHVGVAKSVAHGTDDEI